eukprot:5588884-Prymnesium_polylepis.2
MLCVCHVLLSEYANCVSCVGKGSAKTAGKRREIQMTYAMDVGSPLTLTIAQPLWVPEPFAWSATLTLVSGVPTGDCTLQLQYRVGAAVCPPRRPYGYGSPRCLGHGARRGSLAARARRLADPTTYIRTNRAPPSLLYRVQFWLSA